MAWPQKLLIVGLIGLLCACGDSDGVDPVVPPTDLGGGAVDVDMGGSDTGPDAAAEQDMDNDEPDVGSPLVVVEKPRTFLKVAEGMQLVATYLDEDSEVDDSMTFEWSSEDDTVATVDDEGLVLGGTHGRTRVLATAEDGTVGVAVIPVAAPALDVAAGRAHTCATNAQGWTYCSGDNAFKQLAREDPLPEVSAVRVTGLAPGLIVNRVLAGDDHSCGYGDDGNLHCWGRNTFGQLGQSGDNSRVPIQTSVGNPARQLFGSSGISCALLEEGILRCAGDNRSNVISGTDAESVETFRAIHQTESWVQIGLGDQHICALNEDFELYCWGDSSMAQLGPNGSESTHELVRVPGLFASIWAGANVSCANSFTDELFCWGNTPATIDGVLEQTADPTPVTFPAPGEIRSVGFMRSAICASLDIGTFCWGDNDRSQLGDGSNDNRYTPAAVVGAGSYRKLSCGADHCCGLSDAGDIFCWGANGQGQLSDGSSTNRRRATFFSPAVR